MNKKKQPLLSEFFRSYHIFHVIKFISTKVLLVYVDYLVYQDIMSHFIWLFIRYLGLVKDAIDFQVFTKYCN